MATLAAIGAIFLWCWSGVCFAMGSRAIGAMPYVALISAVGVATLVTRQAFCRQSISGLVLLPPRVIIAGFFGVAVYTVMLVGAFGMAPDTDIGQINLINYLWPIGVVLLSVWLLDEKPRIALTLGGVLLGFSGVAVSRGFDNVLRPPQSWLPLGMAFVAAMLWSGFCVLLRRWKVPETQNGMALHFTGCAILAALIALLTGGWERCFPMKPQTLFWVLFCGIGPVGLAYHWWEVGLKKGNIHLIAVLSFFIPIGSTLLLSLFFRLAINPGLYLGAVLIVLAAIFVRRATGER